MHILKLHLPILVKYLLNIDVGFIDLKRSQWLTPHTWKYIIYIILYLYYKFNLNEKMNLEMGLSYINLFEVELKIKMN